MHNPQSPASRGFWTTVDLAEAAGVSDAYIRQLLLAHKMPAAKAGRVWIIPYEVGQHWLDHRARKNQEPQAGNPCLAQ